MTMTNSTRSNRFAAFIRVAAGNQRLAAQSDQESLTDLLADAMHWCDTNGEDFHIAMAQACRHYINELNDEQFDERRMSLQGSGIVRS